MNGFVEGVPLGTSISASQISTYSGCKYKWWLRYVKGLVSQKTHSYISLGKAVHAGIAAYYNGENHKEAMRQIFQDDINNNSYIDEELGMINSVWENALHLSEVAISSLDAEYIPHINTNGKPSVECEFNIPITFTNHITHLNGFIDLIAEEKNTPRVWLIDHKVVKNYLPDESEEYNIQMAMYQYLLTYHLNVPSIVGSVYNQICSRPLSEPELTKKGGMSRVAIRCTWEKYEKALIENGLDPEDYQEMKGKLSGISLTKPLKAHRSDIELVHTWEYIIKPVILGIEECHVKGRVSKLRHFNMFCKSCWARHHCMADLRGEDMEFIEHVYYEPYIKYEAGDNVLEGEEVEDVQNNS